MEILLEMLFLIFSSANLRFPKKKLVRGAYSAAKALPTTQRIEIIGKKKFMAAALDKKDETFVVHMAAISVKATLNIYLSQQAQIALLKVKEITILSKYADYINIFLPDSVAELPEHTDMHNNPINLINNKQPPHGLIYSLGPIKLETLKTYIKINLANSFIRLSKLPASASILFICKKSSNL